MKSGETGIVAITCNGVNSEEVDRAIFTLSGAKTVTKTSDNNDVLIKEGGVFEIILHQEDTMDLAGAGDRKVLIEGQIVFTNRSVAKTLVTELIISKTLATEIIENNSPDADQLNSVRINMSTAIATMDFSALDKIIEDKIKALSPGGGSVEEMSKEEMLDILRGGDNT